LANGFVPEGITIEIVGAAGPVGKDGARQTPGFVDPANGKANFHREKESYQKSALLPGGGAVRLRSGVAFFSIYSLS
jgi:hypothetical protein